MLSHRFRSAAVAGVALAGIALAAPANAAAILTFGQSGGGNPIVGTETAGVTTITTLNTTVSISQIDAALPPNTAAFLNIGLTSVSAATFVGLNITQDFSGFFSITSLANGGGINYLSGSLIDVAFGQGAAFTLSASTPPSGNVVFSSDVITDLNTTRAASLSFANVSSALAIQQNSISSFTASVSGTFSGNPFPVPEPTSLALLGLAVVAVGTLRHHRGKNTIAY